MQTVHIGGEDILYRRILDYHQNPATGRISASAFMQKTRLDPEVSVYLARLADPARIVRAGLPKQRLLALRVQAVLDLGLAVLHGPTDEFVAHRVITGFSAERWKEQCAKLANVSSIVDVSFAEAE